jgi:glycosyltransferase involved in cell wall biosynthesis
MIRRMANVLVVSAHLPFPPRWGFGMRVYQLMRQIASRHDATLLCYAAPGNENVERLRQEFPVEVVHRAKQGVVGKRASQLRSLASRVPYDVWTTHSREMQGVIDRMCAEKDFEIIQLESTLLALFRFPPSARIVVDEHNVDYETYARMHETERSPLRKAFYRSQERRFERFEQAYWREAAAVVATSEREAEIMRSHAPDTAVAAVPNGVDVEYFRPGSEAVERGTLVFNGVLDYRPNIDGVNFLVDEVLPLVRKNRPDVRLTVVGRGSDADVKTLQRRGVDATGEVPDVRPYLQRAEVVVVPIRMGSGTRLKVVEGLAMGKPVVSTTLGCEGVSVHDGEHLLIGDTAAAFAMQIEHLFGHPEVGEALGRAGRGLTEREYSWDYAGELLEDVYQLSLQRSTKTERVTT